MELFELIKHRRAIRKYQDRQVPKADLEKIIEAGLYAPSAGGGQRSMIVGVQNREVTEKLGKLNRSKFGRAGGGYVSKDQPSIIDDANIQNAFYDAPTVCVIFAQDNFLYSIADSFCCAENMVLMATDMGIGACIVARAEDTFDNEFGKELMKEWGVPENYIARCFVTLGYCDGDYPPEKPRKENRSKIIE